MPILDFHTHTFPDTIAEAALDKLRAASHTRPFSDGTVKGLCRSMERAGITASVVLPVATNARQVCHVNDASIALHDRAGQTGVYSFGCMHPDYADCAAELRRLAAAGIPGIKLHPVYQGVDFDDPRYLRILDAAGQLGLIVLIHAGWDVGFPGAAHATPPKILRAVKTVGPVKLVLAHMGGWRCWQEAARLLPDTGAYIDTSFSLGEMTPDGEQPADGLSLLTPEQFMKVIRAFGADRVLFGSDSPWDDQRTAVERIGALPLTEAERRKILWENGCGLLGSCISARVMA